MANHCVGTSRTAGKAAPMGQGGSMESGKGQGALVRKRVQSVEGGMESRPVQWQLRFRHGDGRRLWRYQVDGQRPGFDAIEF